MGPLVKVMAGSANQTLAAEIADALAAKKTARAIVVAEPAKDPRTSTEVWYQAGLEEAAREVASDLRVDFGAIEPKKWEWGGPYEVIVVVGPSRIVKSK